MFLKTLKCTLLFFMPLLHHRGNVFEGKNEVVFNSKKGLFFTVASFVNVCVHTQKTQDCK